MKGGKEKKSEEKIKVMKILSRRKIETEKTEERREERKKRGKKR